MLISNHPIHCLVVCPQGTKESTVLLSKASTAGIGQRNTTSRELAERQLFVPHKPAKPIDVPYFRAFATPQMPASAILPVLCGKIFFTIRTYTYCLDPTTGRQLRFNEMPGMSPSLRGRRSTFPPRGRSTARCRETATREWSWAVRRRPGSSISARTTSDAATMRLSWRWGPTLGGWCDWPTTAGAGQFQGLFVENVETEFTSEVAP
jgi:hypothetical protein